jgi:ligand-binding sensor domain-containing protein/signal transduction histidine kinase
MTGRPQRIADYARSLLAFVFLTAICAHSVQAIGTGVFDHFGLPEGLSQATVHCIMEDQKGFLWVGTDDGLNRFDGRRFVTFRSNPSDSLTLFDNGVWSLLELDSNTILVGTQRSGLNHYDRKTGVFSALLPDSVIALLAGSAFTSLCVSVSGEYWAGTNDGGLIQFDDKFKVLRLFQSSNAEPDKLPTNRIRCVCPDIDGSVWIGTSDAGLLRFDPVASRIESFSIDSQIASSTQIQDLHLAEDGTLWIAIKGHGVRAFDRTSRRFVSVFPDAVNSSLAGLLIRDMRVDGNGVMWLATGGKGLVRLDTKSNEYCEFLRGQDSNGGPADNQLLCVSINRNGDVWCGTWGNGFSRMRQQRSAFESIQPCFDSTGEHVLEQIIGLAETANGNVMVGTLGGGVWVLGSVDATCVERLYTKDGRAVLTDGSYTSFLPNLPDGIWMGTYRSGLQYFDLNTRELRAANVIDTSSILSPATTVLCAVRSFDRTGWLGTAGESLVKLELAGQAGRGTVSHVPHLELSNDILYSLFEDSRHNLWIGTLNGLDVLDSAQQPVRTLRFERRDSMTLSNNEVRVITEDRDGDVWIGTSNGLNRFRPSSNELWRYSESDGLANSVIYSCVVDRNGDVWVSTNRGISRIHARSDRIENFYTSDGIPHGEFNQGAGLLLSNDAIMFGSTGALVRFHPDSVRVRHVPFVILGITDFRTNQVIVREIEHGEVVRIRPESNSIAIEYVPLDFYGGSILNYEYRLEGLDSKWIKGYHSTTAVFTNLAPGSYKFSVRRRDDELPISAQCEFIIEPAWYQTRAAKAGAGVLALLAIFLSYGSIMRREARKRDEAVQREIQRGINRRLLLDSLAVVSHGGTVASNLNRLKRQLGVFVDGLTPSPEMNFENTVHTYTAFTREKLLDIAAKARIAEISEPPAVEIFANRLASLDRHLECLGRYSEPAKIVECALSARNLVTEVEDSIAVIARTVGQYFIADVISACQTVLDAKREVFEAKSIDVVFEHTNGEGLDCLFTKQELEEILEDLLNNSIEAMIDSPVKRITLSVQDNHPHVKIKLSDTGKGIDPSKYDAVFDRDFSTKFSNGGGFGLYNAKQKVEHYQGKIAFSDPSDGVGAEITLKLRSFSYPELHAKT